MTAWGGDLVALAWHATHHEEGWREEWGIYLLIHDKIIKKNPRREKFQRDKRGNYVPAVEALLLIPVGFTYLLQSHRPTRPSLEICSPCGRDQRMLSSCLEVL